MNKTGVNRVFGEGKGRKSGDRRDLTQVRIINTPPFFPKYSFRIPPFTIEFVLQETRGKVRKKRCAGRE